MTPAESVKNQQFHRKVAALLDDAFNGYERPSKVGFALFVFEFGKTKGGQVNYISNAARPEMLTAVREWLARAEGRTAETETRQ